MGKISFQKECSNVFSSSQAKNYETGWLYRQGLAEKISAKFENFILYDLPLFKKYLTFFLFSNTVI